MTVLISEQPAAGLDSSADWSEVLRLTGELFPGPVSVERMSDPERPSESWAVLTVAAQGDAREWHEQVARQFPEQFPGLRLSICPSP
jgi:hypothetical protein